MKDIERKQKQEVQKRVLALAKKLAEYIGDIDEKRHQKIMNKS